MTDDEKEIRNLVARWHSATAEGDVETVLGLMAEDVVFLVPGQAPMRGRSTFERGLRGLLTTHRIESTGDVQEVRVSGDLAYCWTVLNVRVVPLAGGDPDSRSGSALTILRKQANGAWVAVRDANLLAVTPG
ncbi:MAG: SgcJ/EcaC family oxidoreductase [Burkholderia sp.]|nr:SgcJ/EcaC family oxidoreductase [Burkholderia sp.]